MVPKLQKQFNKLDSEIIQAHELGTLSLELRQSKIPSGALGLFTSKRFGACEVIGQYYGILVYDNLSVGSSNNPALYGEGMMFVPVNNIMKYAL